MHGYCRSFPQEADLGRKYEALAMGWPTWLQRRVDEGSLLPQRFLAKDSGYLHLATQVRASDMYANLSRAWFKMR